MYKGTEVFRGASEAQTKKALTWVGVKHIRSMRGMIEAGTESVRIESVDDLK